MTANELLCYLTEKQMEGLFRAVRALPEDKLDWQPEPGARSARDQLQEIATVLQGSWDMYTKRKLEWDQAKMAQWMEERKKITSIDELEKLCRESTEKLCGIIRDLPPEDFDAPVEMPFPGQWKMADILSYHYWNMSYHEGQINYIGSLLGVDAAIAAR